MNFTVQLHLAITPDPNPLYSKANSHKVEPEEIWDVYKKCILHTCNTRNLQTSHG